MARAGDDGQEPGQPGGDHLMIIIIVYNNNNKKVIIIIIIIVIIVIIIIIIIVIMMIIIVKMVIVIIMYMYELDSLAPQFNCTHPPLFHHIFHQSIPSYHRFKIFMRILIKAYERTNPNLNILENL